MAKETIFTKIRDLADVSGIAGRTKKSREWFMNKSRELGRGQGSVQLLRDTGSSVARPRIGRLYYFLYDPKTKKDLPYYDRFPVIFMVDSAPGGFYGINLHYLPPGLRFILMTKLMTITTNKKFDSSTKLRLSYQVLSSTRKFKEFSPCFKHYLVSHVRSKFLKVESQDWETAVFLPSQQFKKASSNKVWADSRRKI